MPVNDALEPIAALWDCVGAAVVEVVLLFDWLAPPVCAGAPLLELEVAPGALPPAVGVAEGSGYEEPRGLISKGADCAIIYMEAAHCQHAWSEKK